MISVRNMIFPRQLTKEYIAIRFWVLLTFLGYKQAR